MDFTGNPWIIDPADVTGLVAVSGNGNSPGDVVFVNGLFQRVVWKGPAPILQVEMVNYTLDTDTAQVNRYNGKDFAFLNGAADLETVRSGVVGWTMDGLLVPNNGLAHGELKIYHR